MNTQKTTYTKPTLIVHGTMKELTLAATNKGTRDGGTGNKHSS